MKRNKPNLRDFLDQAFERSRNILPASVDPAWERVRERLKDEPEGASECAPIAANSVRPVWKLKWAAAATITIVLLIPTAMLWRGSAPALLESEGGSRKIRYDEIVRSDDGGGKVLVLRDGSQIEMRSKSELALEAVDDGVRIRLDDGGIIVSAAKQGKGHLHVQTKDVMVSVIGTVFLVNTEKSGSLVGVVEGEVEVRFGTAMKTLTSGEQMATTSSMDLRSLAEELGWSRNAPAHLALLPQAPLPQAPRSQALPTQPLPEAQIGLIRPKPSVGGPQNTPVRPSDEVDSFIRQSRAESEQRDKQNQELVNSLHPPPRGKDVFDRACNGCHSYADAWRSFPSITDAEDLISHHIAIGAPVSSAEVSDLADYLFTHGGNPRN